MVEWLAEHRETWGAPAPWATKWRSAGLSKDQEMRLITQIGDMRRVYTGMSQAQCNSFITGFSKRIGDEDTFPIKVTVEDESSSPSKVCHGTTTCARGNCGCAGLVRAIGEKD